MAKKEKYSCEGCGRDTISISRICIKCSSGRHSIGMGENIRDGIGEYEDELSNMFSRSDDDGWAYADDPAEKQADPSWRKLMRDR